VFGEKMKQIKLAWRGAVTGQCSALTFSEQNFADLN
jgi:hypothetical protein